MTNKLINIVTPVYNDYQSLNLLIKKLNIVALKNKYLMKLFIIDDCSEKKHCLKINSLSNVKITLLKNKHNIGPQASIFVAINYLKNKINKNSPTIIMDCDGEDSPEDIPILLKCFIKNKNKIIVAKRTSRSEFKILYNIYKFIFKIFTSFTIDFGNFMILNQNDLNKISDNEYTSSHLPSAIIKAKLPLVKVPLKKGVRYFGESKMKFERLIYHGIKSISIFADVILANLIKFLLILLFFLFLIVVTIVVIRLNYDFFIPGQAGFILGIVFILISILLGNALIALFIYALSNQNNFYLYENIIKKIEKIK